MFFGGGDPPLQWHVVTAPQPPPAREVAVTSRPLNAPKNSTQRGREWRDREKKKKVESMALAEDAMRALAKAEQKTAAAIRAREKAVQKARKGLAPGAEGRGVIPLDWHAKRPELQPILLILDE